jgi:hypothetical protein
VAQSRECDAQVEMAFAAGLGLLGWKLRRR